MYQKIAKDVITFINNSPSCFHAVANIENHLTQQGFQRLDEGENWNLKTGGNYFVTRNQSSLIAFKIPKETYESFQITASHSDSPSFKIKECNEIQVENQYTVVNVEKYGGMLCAPWFDRPLSVAGRVIVKEEGSLISKLVHLDRDLLMIPSLAIHMNREANEGYHYNAQKDLLPLLGDASEKGILMSLVADEAKVKKEEIYGSDLFLYNREKGKIWGAKEEFLSSGRLDDLQCAFTCLLGFLAGGNKRSVSVYCVFDNEEVGSSTKQGAESTFLMNTLERIQEGMGRTKEDYYKAIASSFMLSADNAHAVHPNYVEKADPTNRPFLNKGIVIKYNANQKYTTDGISSAIFKQICEMAKVPYQSFANRSDMQGGSTLGNISNTKVSLNTADIGLPQLAMHSPYETAGVKDSYYLVKAAEMFYSCRIKKISGEQYQILE